MNSPLLLLASLVLSFAVGTVSAAQLKLTGHIGGHKLSFTGKSIDSTASYTVKGQPEYLAITELYPDTASEVEYRYRVSADGTGVYHRTRKSLGFGPISYFIKVNKHPLGSITIRTDGKPVCIQSVRGVSAQELQKIKSSDSFRLMGLIPTTKPAERQRLVDVLMTRLRTVPEYHISRGMAFEIRYANMDAEGVKAELALSQKWAKQYQVPMMLGMVSWWVGTPLGIPDGLGGTFGDLKYQQICYSPDVEMPDDPALRSLLGDRYNRHYGLTTPNMWSNTPWLTMNSDVLNNYRYKRMMEAIGALKQISPNDDSWVSGIFLENEPRYWDTQMEAGNTKAGRQGKPVWADFNPLVIEAARKDGVDIDPADGMSNAELSWMHQNVGRYGQNTVNGINTAIKTQRWGQKLPIYTHSMQFQHFYGGEQIKHATSEWAYAKGARTGIEGMFCNVSDFYRIREWGPWVNLNREETDGLPTDAHLWDLRVDYMMGGELYNSYNWHILGEDRFFDYVNKFLDNLPVVNLRPAQVRYTSADSLTMRAPMQLQAFTGVRLPVEVLKPVNAQISMVVKDGSGNEYSSQPQTIELKPSQHSLSFEFPTPAECGYQLDATVSLRVTDAKGQALTGMVGFVPASAEKMMLSLDLQAQRNLSQWVIQQSKAQSWK
ncbi:MAG: hypothetical protein ACYC1M_08410 [Armatimonadota bacterium]